MLRHLWPLGLLLLIVTPAQALDRIVVRLDEGVVEQPIAGRLFVFFSQASQGEPRFGPNWFSPEPFFGRDIQSLAPGKSTVLDASADGFPGPLDELTPGEYRVQAVLHQDFDSPFAGRGVGNPYSEVSSVQVTAGPGEISLALSRRIERPRFNERDWIKEIVLPSPRLSKFHRRDVDHLATIVLPASYDQQPARRYPVIYSIPGFGGGHRDVAGLSVPPPADETGVEFIRVYLSGQCLWGHHVYADSATNGPRGEAFIRELIPHVDQTWRTVPHATARFVTGHSSGGWSSLWLQVTYPQEFGGVWSLAPDPVDFRDYQQVDLYATPPQNMYRLANGERLPIARRGGKPVLWYDDFTKMDDVLKRGGQLRSFEAVFSPVDSHGEPLRMYDRRTGQVDPTVVKAWEAYDIRLKLERGWPTLADSLRGKLRIYMGDVDTFYLDGATKRLGASLKQLGSDAMVEIIPDADHGSFLTPEFRARIRREMGEQFLKKHPQ